MEVICLQDEAFYVLIEKVVERIKEKEKLKDNKWISTVEAMELMTISDYTDPPISE